MILTQQNLHAELVSRVRSARPDLAADLDMSTMEGLRAAQSRITGTDPETGLGAVSVIREFDPVSWIRATVTFAAALTPEAASTWRTAFTRTYFLAGNPANLRDRFDFEHLAEDGSAAWTHPAEAATSRPLRRLLKLFEAPAPLPHWPGLEITIPSNPPTPRTLVAVRETHPPAGAGAEPSDGRAKAPAPEAGVRDSHPEASARAAAASAASPGGPAETPARAAEVSVPSPGNPAEAPESAAGAATASTGGGGGGLPGRRALVALPGGPGGRSRTLYVATAGATLDRSLVHLNHLLVEAVFDGLLGAGDRLVLRSVPRLAGVPGPFAALRIGTDPANPRLLRAFAALTEENPDA